MTSETTLNQYAAPGAAVADVAQSTGYAPLSFFSTNGRIGRLRYLAYAVGIGFLINFALGIVAGVLAAAAPSLAVVISMLAWIPVLWYAIIVGIKRANDFNASGWWSIVSLIPLIGFLVWMLIPGSKGDNNYGPPPPPNTWGVRITALIMPVAIIGILAAVAIPAYKDYTVKARAAQQQQQAPAPQR